MRFRGLLATCVLVCAAAVPAVTFAQTKVGFVKTERILNEATPAVRARKKIEGEFQPRDQELGRLAEQLKRMQEDLEKNAVTMSDSQRRNKEREFGEMSRDFQRRQREFREDLNQRRNEALAQVVQQAERVIRSIAQEENYDAILQDAVFVNPRIDITDRVIKALNEQ